MRSQQLGTAVIRVGELEPHLPSLEVVGVLNYLEQTLQPVRAELRGIFLRSGKRRTDRLRQSAESHRKLIDRGARGRLVDRDLACRLLALEDGVGRGLCAR